MKTLTKRQREIYDFIKAYVEKYGFAPSYAEIGRAFGMKSQASIWEHLHNIQERGWIILDYNKKRSMELLV